MQMSSLYCYTERKHGDEQDHTEMDPYFCKPVLADTTGKKVDGQSQQQGPLGENQPSSNRDINSKEKMGMAWPHIEKAQL